MFIPKNIFQKNIFFEKKNHVRRKYFFKQNEIRATELYQIKLTKLSYPRFSGVYLQNCKCEPHQLEVPPALWASAALTGVSSADAYAR